MERNAYSFSSPRTGSRWTSPGKCPRPSPPVLRAGLERRGAGDMGLRILRLDPHRSCSSDTRGRGQHLSATPRNQAHRSRVLRRAARADPRVAGPDPNRHPLARCIGRSPGTPCNAVELAVRSPSDVCDEGRAPQAPGTHPPRRPAYGRSLSTADRRTTRRSSLAVPFAADPGGPPGTSRRRSGRLGGPDQLRDRYFRQRTADTRYRRVDGR